MDMTVSSPISPATLMTQLGTHAGRFDVDVLISCDSSNTVVLARAEAGAPSGTVVVAEEQTAGRGRRGRQWLSSPGDSLIFSVLWRFPDGKSLSGLSLAVGVAVARALEKLTTTEALSFQLKWPNDILRDGRKLGGILIELLPGAPHVVVIGVGLNRHVPKDLPAQLRPSTTDIGMALDPNALLGGLLKSLATTLDVFSEKGFAVLCEEWTRRHAYQNCAVWLSSDFAPPQEGFCRGAAPDGALILEVGGERQRIISGEVTLRLAP